MRNREMKRPPGFCIVFCICVLWTNLEEVYSVRATSLIFAKTTTTTTTTENVPEESVTEQTSTESSNTTKPTLTGIPQIDYIWDPNLPQELNGYNLSEYPFYERVPEDIDFKCDGLHDGFYASVPHKCQVYHHCLFGTRYDFLCANYTAFDQKTFICHFVSEVDCLNSKKYWHRNDALYKAASTTTVKPTFVYTPPPQPPALLNPEAQPSAPEAPRRPLAPPGSRRKPLRPRRPLDYYDYDLDDYDYYETRRRRPRPRPRPIVYDDDYEEYDDPRYDRRRYNRKPYNRRGPNDRRNQDRRRNKDRRKYEDDPEDYPVDEEPREDDRRKLRNDKRTGERRRRPSVEDEEDQEEFDRRRNRPRGRKPQDDYYDEEEKVPEEKSVIKPSSGSSIYDRPRAAPKIKPPVPKNEANKYAYKPAATKAPAEAEEEYYDDYEESKNNRKSESTESRRYSKPTNREETRETKRPNLKNRARDEEPTSRRPYRPRFRTSTRSSHRVEDDYYDDYEDTKPKGKEQRLKERDEPVTIPTTTITTTTTTTPKPTTTTTAAPQTTTVKERNEGVVRIVKRPFLPSRGGNPYSSRGLQPIGAKALNQQIDDEAPAKTPEPDVSPVDELQDEPKPFKPSPVVIKVPVRQKFAPITNTDDTSSPRPLFRQNLKPKEFAGPRTTQKPKVIEKNPLDINENEYDVTLNDALNPTLPNLPVRAFPSGFGGSNDYTYIQRPRYVLDPILTSASSEFSYQTKPHNGQRYETIAVQPFPHRQDYDNKGQYTTASGQFDNGQNYHPRPRTHLTTYYNQY